MRRLLSLSVFLMIAAVSFAHDFEVVNADGKTIYCNITSSSDLTVAVTYQGTYSDARHAVGNGDGCQAATSFERRLTDARHTVGNGDGCQAATAKERVAANARHAVSYNIGFNLASKNVF